MDRILITRPVTVIVRVTEGYKKVAAGEVRETVARLDAQLKHIDFQMKKIAEAEKNNSLEIAGNLQKIDMERQKILESRSLLAGRLKEIGGLCEGQEIVHGRVESFVDVSVGDEWGKIMSVELVLQDGQVVEIRQGKNI